MRYLLICLVFLNLCSCISEEPIKFRHFSNIKIEPLLQDSLLNVRALDISNGRVVAATSKGDIYTLMDDGFTFGKTNFNLVEGNTTDSIERNNFRAISQVKSFQKSTINIPLAITIGSPAKLYKHGVLVYQENHKKAFYDSMDFWNNQEGIAIGDPTEDCMSIIITRNGGDTWTKLPCEKLPKAKDGEAAFAASDTNISIIGNHTWVATGGKASRVLYSSDKGKTWQIYNTPIIQGKETTGIYSIDFYDEKNGFAIGGDYTKPNDTLANKIRTTNGGKTWQIVANGKKPSYRSCVQYIPNSNAKELVTVGFKGIDYSNDSGNSWTHISDEGFYTIRFLNDSVAYAAGKGRISKLTFRFVVLAN